MNKKPYTFVEIDVLLWEDEDVVTLSSPSDDDQNVNDVTSDDIFG